MVREMLKAIGIFFATLALLFIANYGAQAQTPAKRPALTGNIPADIANAVANKAVNDATGSMQQIGTALLKPFQDLAAYIGDDIDGTIALATATDIKDGHGQQCAIALKSFGNIAKAHPVPITLHIAQDWQAVRLLMIAANNLCSNVHCTQVFGDASALAQAISPIPLAIPGLHDLCGKIPQVAVVDPVPYTIIPAVVAPTPAAPQ